MFSYNDLKRVTETWYVSNPNSWFLCFSQVSSVKTWFLQLDLTWGKSLKAMSPSRCVVHTLLSPLCVNVCNECFFVALVSPHILVSLCSCGISEVNPGSGVCGSVTAGESAPSCESPCTKLSRMMLKCNAGLRVKEKKKKKFTLLTSTWSKIRAMLLLPPCDQFVSLRKVNWRFGKMCMVQKTIHTPKQHHTHTQQLNNVLWPPRQLNPVKMMGSD